MSERTSIAMVCVLLLLQAAGVAHVVAVVAALGVLVVPRWLPGRNAPAVAAAAPAAPAAARGECASAA